MPNSLESDGTRGVVGRRRTTGLAGLDAQLSGGIPKGTVHVLLSEPMNAQELFCFHFAAGGTQSSETGCAYVATEASEDEVRNGVATVGGAVDHFSVTTLPVKGRWSFPDPKPDQRYILDSFSSYVQAEGWDEAMAWLQQMKLRMRETGGNLLVTALAGLHDVRETALLKQWADGVMELGFDRQGFGLYPYLKVTKMRGVPDSARFLLFKETEKGLFMESTRRVF